MDRVSDGFLPHTYLTVTRNGANRTDGGVIDETQITVRLNGHHVASMMCSPLDEVPLALGFLYNEGMIENVDQVERVDHEQATRCLNVLLPDQKAYIRRHMIMTSGCGGGVTFHEENALRNGVDTAFVTVPDVIFQRMRDLKSAARLYNRVRGVHTSLLGTATAAIYSAEDVGRHNTIDKIAGKALQDRFEMSDCVLLTSGRVSSEMLSKANRMNIPVIASRTAPTSTSVRLAERWQICLIGYVRQDSMRVYTHPWRLGLG